MQPTHEAFFGFSNEEFEDPNNARVMMACPRLAMAVHVDKLDYHWYIQAESAWSASILILSYMIQLDMRDSFFSRSTTTSTVDSLHSQVNIADESSPIGWLGDESPSELFKTRFN